MADETPPESAVPDLATPSEIVAPPAAAPLPPAWRGVLVAIGASVAAAILLLMLTVPVAVVLQASGRTQEQIMEVFNANGMAMMVLMYVFLAGFLVAGIALFYRMPRERFGWRRPATTGWILGVPLLTLPMVLTSAALEHGSDRVLYQISPSLGQWAKDLSDALMKSLPSDVWSYQGICFIILAVVMAPLVEEFLFRGLVFEVMRRRGFWPAALGSSFVFSLVHINPLGLVSIFLLAILLAWQRERSGSLAPCMLLHALYNGTSVAANFLARGG